MPTEDFFELSPRQPLALTTVGPPTESKNILRLNLTVNVELIRVREMFFVAIRGLDRTNKFVAFLYSLKSQFTSAGDAPLIEKEGRAYLPTYFNILVDCTPAVKGRRCVVAGQLHNDIFSEFWILLQLVALIRV